VAGMSKTKRRKRKTITTEPTMTMAEFIRQMLTGERAPIPGPTWADYAKAANLAPEENL
jgi:hypothetical protein